MHLQLAQQNPGLIPNTAFHSDRTDNGRSAAEIQLRQIHLKPDLLTGVGGMQQSVYIQSHSTPLNDTNSIIEDCTLLVKHFLRNILTISKNQVQ